MLCRFTGQDSFFVCFFYEVPKRISSRNALLLPIIIAFLYFVSPAVFFSSFDYLYFALCYLLSHTYSLSSFYTHMPVRAKYTHTHEHTYENISHWYVNDIKRWHMTLYVTLYQLSDVFIQLRQVLISFDSIIRIRQKCATLVTHNRYGPKCSTCLSYLPRKQRQYGMLFCWPLTEILSRCSALKWSHCNAFDDQVPMSHPISTKGRIILALWYDLA